MLVNNNKNKNVLYIHITKNMSINGIVSPMHNNIFKATDMLNVLRNTIIKKGKKTTADKVVNNMFILLRSSGIVRPLMLVASAITKLMPVIETRPIKRGGKVLQVPSTIKYSRQYILAVQWLVEAAKHRASKSNKGMYGLSYGIAQELRAIYLDAKLPSKAIVYSEAMSKRNMIHKNANRNRVHLHILKNKKKKK